MTLICSTFSASVQAGGSSWASNSAVVDNITSRWIGATISTGSVPQTGSATTGVTYSWSDVPAKVTDASVSVSIPPSMFVRSMTPRNMALIPSGPFRAGAGNPGGHFVNALPRNVDVVSYNIDIREVTGALWSEVREWATNHGYVDLVEGQAGYSATNGPAGPNHPVVDVSWYDCVKWCNARSEKEGFMPLYYTDRTQVRIYRTGVCDVAFENVDWSASGYRLPTEAEWEKACRGGSARNYAYPWGNTIEGYMANFKGSGDPYDDGTTPVEYFSGKQIIKGKVVSRDMVNDYGMYDMIGNVGEWCWDWYSETTPDEKENPRGAAKGTNRSVRGGAWNIKMAYELCCFYRSCQPPAMRSKTIGFRCAKGL